MDAEAAIGHDGGECALVNPDWLHVLISCTYVKTSLELLRFRSSRPPLDSLPRAELYDAAGGEPADVTAGAHSATRCSTGSIAASGFTAAGQALLPPAAGAGPVRDGGGGGQRPDRSAQSLLVATDFAFAVYWLDAAVLSYQLHPGIDVSLVTNRAARPDARHRPGHRVHDALPGADAQLLFREEVFAVCSPRTVAGNLSGRTARNCCVHAAAPQAGCCRATLVRSGQVCAESPLAAQIGCWWSRV
jgi:hypothetical protein